MNPHSRPIVPVDQASTEPATPPPAAPVPTELTADQMIRLTALDRAITFAQYRDALDDPAGWALDAAARFEAYIRDGAA